MPKRGFTLIEVVIALVIFVIGALAVIRIFPPTFNAVQNSSYRNIATRMADSIVDQMRGEGSTPEAVFDINESKDEDGNGINDWLEHKEQSAWQDQGGAVEGTTSKNFSLPDGPTNAAYDASALSHFRYIRGEGHMIQNAGGSDMGENAPYILTNFPYVADNVNGGVRLYVTLPIDGVTIKQGENATGDNIEGKLDFSRATYTDPFTGTRNEPFHESGINSDRPKTSDSSSGVSADSNNVTIYYRSSDSDLGITDTGARFYVSYRYVNGTRMSGVINEPLSIPDNDSWNVSGNSPNVARVLQGMLNFKLAGSQPAIVSGSVRVKVRAAVVFNDGTNPIYLGVDQDEGIRGYVSLPPVYTGIPGNTISKMPIVPVSADYLVPDWRILFDQSTPTKSSNTVTLPISLLDQKFTPVAASVDSTSGYEPVSAPEFDIISNIEYKKGRVIYNSAYPTVRTVYKGLDQWALQISPAAESYVPFIDNAALNDFRDPGNDAQYYLPREQWREYYWVSGNKMYFHPSEAGKTVRVQFIPGDSPDHTPIEQILVIDNEIVASAGVPNAFAESGQVAVLTLKNVRGVPVTASSILGVSGMSVLARMAWLNGSDYQQSVVTGYRMVNAR